MSGKSLFRHRLQRIANTLTALTVRATSPVQRSSLSSPSAAAYERATLEFRSGDFDSAYASALAAIAGDPKRADAHHLLGRILQSREDYADAVHSFRTASLCEPRNLWRYCHIGDALLRNGEHDVAIEFLTQVSHRLSDSPWPFVLLGNALLASGKLQRAKQVFRKAQSIKAEEVDPLATVKYADHLIRQTREIDAFVNARLASREPPARPLALMIVPGPIVPPRLGVTQRMFNQMAALNKRTDLVVASLLYDRVDFGVADEMRAYCQLPILVDWSDRPTRPSAGTKTVHRHTSRTMLRSLESLARIHFDIVMTDFVYMAPYKALFPKSFHVLSEHNIESMLLLRNAELRKASNRPNAAALHSEALALERYERQAWPTFPLRWTVSKSDCAVMKERCPTGDVWIVNNGYDTRRTRMLADNPSKKVLFVGTLNYWPNVDAVLHCIGEVMPSVWRRDPDVEFWVAGARPGPEVEQSCATDARIALVKNPDDITEVARQCGIAIVPIRSGSGTRIKILEAFSLGLPTITTPLGCEGLEVIDGEHLLIRDKPEAFADAILDLLSDRALRTRLRTAGRALVEREYDWETIFDNAARKLLERVAASTRPRDRS